MIVSNLLAAVFAALFVAAYLLTAEVMVRRRKPAAR